MNKETRNLIVFFVATFFVTWVTYSTIIFNGWNPYTFPGMVFLLIGGSAPSWVGVFMVFKTYDKEQRRDYFRRCVSFNQVKLPYLAFIIFVFPTIYALLIGLDMLMGGSLPGMVNLEAYLAQPSILPLALFLSFLSVPWSEEFGWRGYSLDPLLNRFGILRGSVILGFIWGIWHLPLFFMLFNIGLTLMMTWVYLGTNRSILTGFLMHLASNFTANTIYPYSDRIEIMRMVVLVALGLTLCILLERKPKQVPAVQATV